MRVTNRMVWAPEGADGGGDAVAAAETPAAEPQSPLAPSLLSAEPTADTQAGADTVAGADTQQGADTQAAPEPMKPEDYKLDLPDGITADDPILASFLEGAAKGGMDNESVQAVVSAIGPKLAEQMQAPVKLWTEMNERWQAEIKADPVIGGAKLDATIATVTEAINLVSASPEEARTVREALTATGAGNHPALVRLLHRMSSRLVEKGAVSGESPAESRSAAAVLYPTHNTAKGG